MANELVKSCYCSNYFCVSTENEFKLPGEGSDGDLLLRHPEVAIALADFVTAYGRALVKLRKAALVLSDSELTRTERKAAVRGAHITRHVAAELLHSCELVNRARPARHSWSLSRLLVGWLKERFHK